MYKPPHKHVGDKDKPGQIVNVPNFEKPLGKLISEFEHDEVYAKGKREGYGIGYQVGFDNGYREGRAAQTDAYTQMMDGQKRTSEYDR